MKSNYKIEKYQINNAINIIKKTYEEQNIFYLEKIEELKYLLNEKENLIYDLKNKILNLEKEKKTFQKNIIILQKEYNHLKHLITQNNTKIYEKPKLKNLNISTVLNNINETLSIDKQKIFNLEPLKNFDYSQILNDSFYLKKDLKNKNMIKSKSQTNIITNQDIKLNKIKAFNNNVLYNNNINNYFKNKPLYSSRNENYKPNKYFEFYYPENMAKTKF